MTHYKQCVLIQLLNMDSFTHFKNSSLLFKKIFHIFTTGKRCKRTETKPN